MNSQKSLGIIGTGSFGSFMVQKLSGDFEIRSYDPGAVSTHSFEEVAQCDFVVLAIPLGAYEQVLLKLRPIMSKTSVVVDICSVKEKPASIVKQWLPDQRILSVHPLFGPQSAADGFSGHTIIVCPEASDADVLTEAKVYFTSLGLKIVDMSLEEHDRQMADVHALTFFIARGLVEYGVGPKEVMAASYQKLIDLAELERHHSLELFKAIQTDNRFAAGSRHKFRKLLDTIDDELAKS